MKTIYIATDSVFDGENHFWWKRQLGYFETFESAKKFCRDTAYKMTDDFSGAHLESNAKQDVFVIAYEDGDVEMLEVVEEELQ